MAHHKPPGVASFPPFPRLLPSLGRLALGLILLAIHWLAPGWPVWSQSAAPVQHYVLMAGDQRTLRDMAVAHQADPAETAALNGLEPDTVLDADHRVIMPIPISAAIVQNLVSMTQMAAYPGQTLERMAQEQGVPGPWLAVINGVKLDQRLFPGQSIMVPDPVHPMRPVHMGQVTVTYASPMIAVGGIGFLALSAPAGLEPHATWLGQPLILTPVSSATDGDPSRQSYISHLPVHPLQEAGVASLQLSYRNPPAPPVSARLPIELFTAHPFSREVIYIPADVASQLTGNVLERETARLDALWQRQSGRLWSAESWHRPLTGTPRTTSAFGNRRRYISPVFYPVTYHSGHDFAAPVGTPVLAPARGVVVLAEPLTTKGLAVILDHGQGVMSGYWHLDEILVPLGATVEPRQIIGTVGNTGISMGAHLHWELRIQGVPVNPLQFLYGSPLPLAWQP